MSKDTLFEKCDFHVHTHLSGCARNEMTLPAILEAAQARGIQHLGITDHIFPNTDSGILKVTARELERLSASMKVYLGCEADILAVGRHTVTQDMKAELDYIAVSSNHYQLEWVSQPRGQSDRAVAEHYLEMFRYACSLSFADIVCHPMQVVSGQHDPRVLQCLEDREVIEAVELARSNNIAMEVSPRVLASGPNGFTLRFYRLCKQVGVKFSFGSDAHALHNVGTTGLLREFARAVGITDEDVWLPTGGC